MSVNVKTPDGLVQIAGNCGGGANPEIESKLEELESLIEQTRALRADLESYGMVKLSDSSAITDSTGLALPATEKNASIEGSLANKIDKIIANTYDFSSMLYARNKTSYRELGMIEPGWVRMFESEESLCSTMLIGITKEFANSTSQADMVVCSIQYTTTMFKNILGVSGDISKIRHVINQSSHKGYIDVYYNSTVNNPWTITLIQAPFDYNRMFKACEPYVVPESVEIGYSIRKSYDIVAVTS